MIVRERLRKWIIAGCIGSTILAGCNTTNRFRAWKDSSQTSYFQSFITQVEYPDLHAPIDSGVSQSLLPLSIENPSQLPTFELSLRDAVQTALQSSDVLRSIGGSVVTAPQGQSTSYDNALSDLNPNAGVEAALAAFDAQVTSRLSWQKNDRPVNFDASGGAGNFFVPINVQTQGIFTNQIQKRTATGAQYALRLNTIYDRNNGRNREFSSDFSGFVEAEYRQPLMQGSGTTFNRIAGPTTVPGQYNGVLIARINTDISIADFEAAVIRLINDVEGAYWELYFAYRALDAQVLGRKSSLETWRNVKEKKDIGFDKITLADEGQARSTFYQFEALLNDALSGPNGLYSLEQRLRYVMGMPASDGRLIKPSDDPMQAEVSFDWQTSVCDALTRRVEVRRQEWTVKRRELELIASRLNRRPRLDALTQYRWRGLGDHLIEERDRDNQFNSLVQNILEGNFQEWQAGLEWQYNVGLRQASAAVRHAQLNLAREMSVLKEQQLRISHDLSNAARQIVSSYTQTQKNYNRVKADEDRIGVLAARSTGGLTDTTFLNQAQLQLATSQIAFYRSLVDYNLALRDFHREKGSLLTYNQVNLAEEALNGSAIEAAFDRGRYFTPRDNPDQVVVRNTVANPQPN